jgi:hypothetical protein
MAKEIELRRHTDSDGDVLTDESVQAALEIGANLRGGYQLLVSPAAQRATQALACFACALGERVPSGALVEPGMRSEVEDRCAGPIRKPAAASSAHCAQPIPGWSKRSRSPSAPPSGGFSTPGRWRQGPGRGTVPPTRRRSSA